MFCRAMIKSWSVGKEKNYEEFVFAESSFLNMRLRAMSHFASCLPVRIDLVAADIVENKMKPL